MSDPVLRNPTGKRVVACAACGRVVSATKHGKPVNHKPHSRLNGGGRVGTNLPYCGGSALAGDEP